MFTYYIVNLIIPSQLGQVLFTYGIFGPKLRCAHSNQQDHYHHRLHLEAIEYRGMVVVTQWVAYVVVAPFAVPPQVSCDSID